MDRLTRKADKGYVFGQYVEIYETSPFKPIVDRLAAYEDTGLMPEEVKALQDVKVLELHQYLERVDMTIEGDTAKAFMAMLIGMFEEAGATNYLTVTVDYKDNHYGITVQKCNAEKTPQEEIADLKARLEIAESRSKPKEEV